MAVCPLLIKPFLSTLLLPESGNSLGKCYFHPYRRGCSPSLSKLVPLRKGGRKPLVTPGISHRHTSSVWNRIPVRALLKLLSSRLDGKGRSSVSPRKHSAGRWSGRGELSSPQAALKHRVTVPKVKTNDTHGGDRHRETCRTVTAANTATVTCAGPDQPWVLRYTCQFRPCH